MLGSPSHLNLYGSMRCVRSFPRIGTRVFVPEKTSPLYTICPAVRLEFESKLGSYFIVGIWPTDMADDMLVDHAQSFSSFSHMLDARILRALAEQGFARPTLVQAKAIPLALEGRDILARARTGSGKTAAYCIPLVQKILNVKSVRL